MTVATLRSRAAIVGVAWALAYLPIHVYWALTASFWPAGDLPASLDPEQWKVANWGASVVIVGAALVCLALDRPWGDLLPRRMLLGFGYVGAVFAILHWGLISAQTVFIVAGATERSATSFDRWNLYVFEPWFLGMGILLAVATAHRARRPRALPTSDSSTAPAAQRLAGVVAAVLVLSGLVVVLFGVMSFSVWTFALYGPALIAAGLGLHLLSLRRRSA